MKTPADHIASLRKKIIEAEIARLPKRANEYIEELISRYDLVETTSKGNAKTTWHGSVNDNSILIEEFGSLRFSEDVLFDTWYSIIVAFGKPYHDPKSRGSGTISANGLATATSSFETRQQIERRKLTGAGTGIPGHNIIGLKWRVNLFKPMSRTTVGFDQYIQTDDIIEYLIGMRSKVPVSEIKPLPQGWIEGIR